MHTPTFSSSSSRMNFSADARKCRNGERRGYQFVMLSNQAPGVLLVPPRCTEGKPLVYSWYPYGVLNTPRCTHDNPHMHLGIPHRTHGIPHCIHDIPSVEHPQVYCTPLVYCTDIMQGVYFRSSLVRISLRKAVRTSYGVSTCSS